MRKSQKLALIGIIALFLSFGAIQLISLGDLQLAIRCLISVFTAISFSLLVILVYILVKPKRYGKRKKPRRKK